MYGKILVAVDGSDSNSAAVDDALKMAKEFGSEITALCVFDVGSYSSVAQTYGLGDEREFMIKSCEESLRCIVTKGKELDVPVAPKIVMGHPAQAIIDESANYDLVVCGTLGRTGMKRVVMGSVAEKVVRMAQCPVLVCRNPVKE